MKMDEGGEEKKRKKSIDAVKIEVPSPQEVQAKAIDVPETIAVPEALIGIDNVPDTVQAPGTDNKVLNTTNDVINRLFQRENTTDLLPHNFSLSYLNQEYLMLGDIILQLKPSLPLPLNTSSDFTRTVSPPLIHTTHRQSTQRPFISLGYEKENDDEYVSPLISHHIYQTVQDIYSNNIVLFDYPQLYHSLLTFLKNRFLGNNLPEYERQQKRQNLLVVLKLIASYRPTFISAHKSLLKPFDLQFLEMSFQRCLIDYERLAQLNSSPTIIWRRTGEIVSITDDLLSILGYTLGDILLKRTFIVELMYDDESIVQYYQLFKSVAVGNLHSLIFTKCKLAKAGSDEFINFCCVWTVKRDLFDLPMLIVGQFLPILEVGDGVRKY